MTMIPKRVLNHQKLSKATDNMNVKNQLPARILMNNFALRNYLEKVTRLQRKEGLNSVLFLILIMSC